MPAGRCIVFLILMFSFSIYQFYSASIVGSLLMEKPKSIKTIRNLIDSSLRLGIEDIVYNKDFFRVSAECVCICSRDSLTCLLARMQRTNDPDAIELFLKKVSVVDKASGNVTLNWIKPMEGLQKTKAGGKCSKPIRTHT